MKTVIDKDIPFIKGIFEPFSEVVYLRGDMISANDVKDADALIIRTRTECDGQLLKASKVRFIATATIGHDHIDTEWCSANGIVSVNAPGCNSEAVKQYITAGLLEAARETGTELSGRTLGIIGVGHVGSKVKTVAEALGMRVLLNDPPREESEGFGNYVDLYTLASESDFVTLHVPLSDGKYGTRLLADENFFDNLKPGAVFINTSRGEVVDESALVSAVSTGRVSTAISDVWQNEPRLSSDLLNSVFIATPHIAGYSLQGKINAAMSVIADVAAFFDMPVNVDPNTVRPKKSLINITKKSGIESEIRKIVRKTYDIANDSSALKKCPEHFESLRNGYVYRREFESFKINVSDSDGKLYDILKNLGFDFARQL